MLKRLLISAAIAAFAAAPFALSAQDAKVSVCKDKTTTTVTGPSACANNGGVDEDATEALSAKTAAEKAEDATEAAAKNTGKAVATGATDAANATAKGATDAANATAKAATDAANATAKGATDAANATAKGATDAAKATKKGAKDASKAVSKGAEDAGKTAKGAAKETVGDVTNATAADATAKCKDGTYSHAKQHAGACAQHGGIAKWLDGKPE